MPVVCTPLLSASLACAPAWREEASILRQGIRQVGLPGSLTHILQGQGNFCDWLCEGSSKGIGEGRTVCLQGGTGSPSISQSPSPWLLTQPLGPGVAVGEASEEGGPWPEAFLFSLELLPFSFHRIFMEIQLLVCSFIDNISDPEHRHSREELCFLRSDEETGSQRGKETSSSSKGYKPCIPNQLHVIPAPDLSLIPLRLGTPSTGLLPWGGTLKGARAEWEGGRKNDSERVGLFPRTFTLPAT